MEKIKLEIKYFPKNFTELHLPIRIQKLIDEQMENNGYRSLLFGSPGTGKTSTSRLMTVGHETLYLSGSNEFNIALMREKVYPFVGNSSVLGKQKTLIIDEFENIADKLQDSFKIILDRAKKVNFIFITNEIEKVNSAIMSRSTKISYDYTLNELEEQRKYYVEFLVNVCNAENIKWDKPGISQLYKTCFPDFRTALVSLQSIIDGGQHVTLETVSSISNTGKQDIELYNIIESINDSKLFYEKCSEYKGKERDCIMSLGEPFFTYLNAKGKFDHTLNAAQIVAKWSNIYVTAINKFTCFFAMCSELKTLFR